jgi:hypothetical protein
LVDFGFIHWLVASMYQARPETVSQLEPSPVERSKESVKAI